jgi:hypothetical protein
MERTRLVSIDNDAPGQEGNDPAIPDSESEFAAEGHDDDPVVEGEYAYEYDEQPAASLRRGWIVPALAVFAILGWTAFFGWANRAALGGVAPLEAIELVGSWAPPVVVIALAWLLAMRTSRREARRFAEAAQTLRLESEQLEARLHRVNGELSVAREFLSQQSRELDTLGRLAVDRIGEHSGRLEALISDNGREVERLSDVSASALENMESLRGNLPVIASSTKDVTNNIAQAGRTARAQLDEMVDGLKRVNEFGQASEAQVEQLRAQVGQALDEFAATTHNTGEALAERYNKLSENVGVARIQFEQEEIEALASLRQRWSAVGEQIKEALDELAGLDEGVIQPAAGRIESMRGEHTALLGDAARANEEFGAELARRREIAEADGLASIETLQTRLATLDIDLGERREAHVARVREVGELSEGLAARIAELAEMAEHAQDTGTRAGETLDHALAETGDRLAATDASLRQTDELLGTLTDTTVRLLELVRATAEHGSQDLPKALVESEQALVLLEERATRINESVAHAGRNGEGLVADIETSQVRLGELLAEFEKVSSALGTGTGDQAERLATIAGEFDRLQDKSEALASHAREELVASIAALREANSAALAQIESEGGEGLRQWAEKIGTASGEAIERELRARIDETAGALDEATTQAAERSREATLQLREQLGKIDELTGNLERRITRAHERAEEQVDNDFSRRAALITESLNSSSIDIAKALSADVADTAWSSYLKGDRGIFTRRAVRLLDNGDAREIGDLYEVDEGFREDVARYIHDFESMLRQLLSTRDGHALGVTLLSSDMGKLYVALAQGIERLRS